MLDGCSAILVSGSNLLKRLENDSLSGWVFSHSHQWQMLRATHQLEGCSAILVSCSDLHHKHWSNLLAGQGSSSLISGHDLLHHWRVTHILDDVQPFSSVILICSNIIESTHSLYMCSAILISGSDLLKQ